MFKNEKEIMIYDVCYIKGGKMGEGEGGEFNEKNEKE